MKRPSALRSLLIPAFCLGTAATLIGCYENTPAASTAPIPPAPIQLTATLNGAQEKPASTTSAATGSFVGTIDRTTRVLSYTLNYTGITPTAGHLHRITNADGTGPVTIPFASLTTPIIGTTAPLAQSRVDSMVAGQFYANLHTPTYPGGEIRGDVRVR